MKFTFNRNVLAVVLTAVITAVVHQFLPQYTDQADPIAMAVLSLLGLKAHTVTPAGDKIPKEGV